MYYTGLFTCVYYCIVLARHILLRVCVCCCFVPNPTLTLTLNITLPYLGQEEGSETEG